MTTTARSHPRFFNTTGPCNPADHYMLPPEERLQGAQLERYIRDKLYWVLHAPRQTGKSTFFCEAMREINEATGAVVCYVNLGYGGGQVHPEESFSGIREAINKCFDFSQMPVGLPKSKSSNPVLLLLKKWAEAVAPAPLVVFFDEVEALGDEALLSLVNQLREGYPLRESGVFPVSVALAGRRNLAEYLPTIESVVLPADAPFTAKDGTARLGYFSKKDVARLFAQRTEETEQRITQEACDYVYEQSCGQPWLVNWLFRRATIFILKEDSTETVTIKHVCEARDQLASVYGTTHLDGLISRMRHPSMKDFLVPLFLNTLEVTETPPAIICMWRDLGFLEATPSGTFVLANPIYREVLVRYLVSGPNSALPPRDNFRWQAADGSFDMDALLHEFQAFWRENSETWEETSNYTEAFPHLLLMAFLQRITNGGGHIDREYAAGRGRLDLLVEYANKRYIIEIKLLRDYDTAETVREEGLAQIQSYRDTAAPDAPAYLVIFDRRTTAKDTPWEQRIKWDTENGIAVLGC